MDRGANAGDHVLALRIHQEFAVEFFGADGGIAGEAHAGAAGVAQIAEHHGLHVHGGAQHVVDVVDAAIVLGAVVVPGAEHGVARHYQLLVRVLRKVALGVLLDHLLVFRDHFLQRLGVQLGIQLRLFLLLLGVENFLEMRSWGCPAPRCRTSGSSGDRSRRRSADCRSSWPAPSRSDRSGRG